MAPPAVSARVADAFVFRRVASDRWAHLGGLGRGEGWAGIVSFDPDELGPGTLPLPGEVRVLCADEPEHRFGPYWSRFAVFVRVERDVVVAMGGPDHVEATADDWRASADHLAAHVGEVSPAKHLADELELLHAVREIALIPPGSTLEVGRQLLARITDALSCEAGVLRLHDGRLIQHVAPGLEVDTATVREGLEALVESHPDETVCRQDARGELGGSWLRSYLVQPVGDRARLAVAHTSAAPRGFTDLCRQLAASTTAAAGTLLRAAEQYETAQRRAEEARAEARLDPLTGVGNRRAWDEAVARHGGDDAVAVVVCDLDGLKELNDAHGHAAGDRYLQAAADVLRHVVREGDVVARLGGDEFAVLLAGADEHQAASIVERIQATCRATLLSEGHHIAMSVGVAVGRGRELGELLERADATMYRRKRAVGAMLGAGPYLGPIGPDVIQPVVSEILRSLLHLPSTRLDEGIDHALESLGETLQVDRSYVFRVDESTCTNTHEWCAPGIDPHIDDLQALPLSVLGEWIDALGRGEAVQVTEVAALPDHLDELRELLQEGGIQSVLVVPMLFDGQLAGFVGFDAVRQRRVFGDVATGLLATVADALAAVDARRQASQRVARAERRTSELLRHSRDHVLLVDADGAVSWASESFRQLGLRPDDLVGRAATTLTHPDDAELVQQLVATWLRSGARSDLTLPDHRCLVGDQVRWVSVVIRDARDRRGLEGLIVAAHDVTQRRTQTERLRHLALHDDLTGLPNRALLKDRLEVALHRAARIGGQVGVLFLGVDGFKVVNDSRSHAVGDELLRQIAERLRATVRVAETAGRFGGDQFVVVLEVEDVVEVERAVARITASFDEPFTVAGQPQVVSASFGLRVAHEGEVDPDAVLRDADNALFAAKARGRARLVTFDPSMRAEAVRHDRVAQRLPNAIADGAIRPHYQPLVDLETGSVVGVEALARWIDHELGAVSPTEFIPVAEQAGLIGALGAHVLHVACRDASAWPPETYVSVNLSAVQLEDPDLVLTVEAALTESGLAPDRLVLEVTESVLMRDTARSIDHLNQLRCLGVRVALDDFGTGHSSLAVLAELPLDILKIDRSFVTRMATDERGARMVDGIVGLAEDLGLLTVAEGVETPAQAQRLRQTGCQVAQGWLFGRPRRSPVFTAPRAAAPRGVIA